MLMKDNNGSSYIIDPAQDPFVYLWLANCVLYSVLIALFMIKRWREKRDLRASKTKMKERKEELYETEAAAIRKNISIAKAEIERLRGNRKMSKKGKKNREKLLEELKNLSIAELISCMDREKSRLRNLKKGFWRSKKLEEAKQLNRKFQLDPKSVNWNFGKMLENQANSEKQ